MPTSSALDNSFTLRSQLAQFRAAWRTGSKGWASDDMQAESHALSLPETRLPKLLKLTIFCLSGSALLFVGWAAVTPVKEVARTEGKVVPSGYSQLVQHLEGGLVQGILVHEGDFVRKGQELVQLDGVGMEEDFREQQALVEALALQAERLHAVVEGRKPDFSSLSRNQSTISEQRRMYDSTVGSRDSERAVLNEQIAQKHSVIKRLRQELQTAQSNFGVAKENQQIYNRLSGDKLVSRTAVLRTQEEMNSRQGDVNRLSRQMQEAAQELTEYQRRRDAQGASQKDAAYSDLHRVETELAQARENLAKRSNRVGRLLVRAPVMGYVKGLRLNTIGAVIPAGETLMEIVPAEEQLVVEARIMPQQVGRVEVGQQVQVKVDSYDYVRYGSIPATLESISAMTFTDEMRGEDYYKGRIKLSRNYAGPNSSANPVLPGMTVDADIVTGEKTVLGYLLKPIQRAMQNAMSEQ